MRTRIVFLLLITVFAFGMVSASETKFFITLKYKGDSLAATAYGSPFITEVSNAIEKTFPCALVNDINSVTTLLGWERTRALLSDRSDEAIKNIGQAMGCRYLISIQITVWNSNVTFNLTCMDSQKAETLANILETGTHGADGLNKMTKISDKLIDELLELEICPYKGTVNIEVKGEKDETTTSTSSAPCGGNLTTTITSKMNSTLTWKFTKTGRNAANGTATYDMNTKLTSVMDFSCYPCKNGKKGAAKITETDESEAKVEGLSNESTFEGNKVDDVRIKIVFTKDGTYMILVEATSKKGVLKTTTEKKVEGTCEDESEPRDTKTKSVDVPLKAVFGPFQGSPEDKVLSEKETKDVSQGTETTTVTIDFNLTRE
ncbi:MAG: hypothetical protein IPM71_05355 [Bacteroidota bacterium]|nr:MAG: hypothetical protein IPM71_05355 [Bacteroidota bacterium]